jgi:hypothetical protein
MWDAERGMIRSCQVYFFAFFACIPFAALAIEKSGYAFGKEQRAMIDDQ